MQLQKTTSLSLAALSLALLSACSSTPLQEPAPISNASTLPSASTAAKPGSVAPVTAGAASSTLSAKTPTQRAVYFDYDSFSIKDQYQNVIKENAQFVAGNKAQKVVIEGNTDERGGREYNLALGQKRAEAVKRGLSLMGTPEAQIEAVSFGSEKPKAQGANETAWAENRRSDISYR